MPFSSSTLSKRSSSAPICSHRHSSTRKKLTDKEVAKAFLHAVVISATSSDDACANSAGSRASAIIASFTPASPPFPSPLTSPLIPSPPPVVFTSPPSPPLISLPSPTPTCVMERRKEEAKEVLGRRARVESRESGEWRQRERRTQNRGKLWRATSSKEEERRRRKWARWDDK